ncbi:MAG: hypothetical protein Q7R51_02850 [bacterium]|nr:hypothetical protein [bacterium]
MRNEVFRSIRRPLGMAAATGLAIGVGFLSSPQNVSAGGGCEIMINKQGQVVPCDSSAIANSDSQLHPPIAPPSSTDRLTLGDAVFAVFLANFLYAGYKRGYFRKSK